jgi:hypothetical protein
MTKSYQLQENLGREGPPSSPPRARIKTHPGTLRSMLTQHSGISRLADTSMIYAAQGNPGNLIT